MVCGEVPRIVIILQQHPAVAASPSLIAGGLSSNVACCASVESLLRIARRAPCQRARLLLHHVGKAEAECAVGTLKGALPACRSA
eukprot:366519-Chlamydomonas_euryale.AAC.24